MNRLMKNEAQIRKKLKDVKFKYLTAHYRDKLQVCPQNCIHNYRHKVKSDEGVEQVVGLCTLGMENPEEWNGNLCDDVHTAQSCPYFTNKRDKESIKDEFLDSLKDEVVVASKYKDIAALQWVLDEKIYSWDLSLLQRIVLSLKYKLVLLGLISYRYF